MRSNGRIRSGVPCQYIFHYDDVSPGEVVSDLAGQMNIPLVGEILQRNHDLWRVLNVSTQDSATPNGPLAVHRIMLQRAASKEPSIIRRRRSATQEKAV